jgi:ADP-ribose pyrophosphatase YjhB (NUDIX family)
MADNENNFYRHMGVYGIGVADNRILVINKILGPYTGKYDLPGGRLEIMESLEQGMTREVREETGYIVQQLKHVGVCDFSVRWRLQDNTVENLHHIAILYEVEIDLSEEVNRIEAFEGQDSSGATWLAMDEVTSSNSSPLVMQAVEWLRTGALPVTCGSFDYTT